MSSTTEQSGPRVERLPDALISKIAAGEVVERPASIVKELLENSLDAGATRIDVRLEEGGRRRIEVRDDGTGIHEADLPLAVERHATSKIRAFDDLERVASYGFRGEALSSIAAVARTEIVSAREEGSGFRIVAHGGRVERVEPIGASKGTTVVVRDLFAEVPARRKFLKGAPAERRRVLEVVQGFALALPEVVFHLVSDGRDLLSTSKTTDDDEGRLERVAQVFGVGLASELVSIPRRPGVSGLLGRPSTAKGRRIFVFVNRRLVRDRGVLAAFYRTVRDEWKMERFPALFLFLDLPREDVDVNVHPQKAEVRFRDQRIIGRVVLALRSALIEARGEGSAPLRGVDRIPASGLAWRPDATAPASNLSGVAEALQPFDLAGSEGQTVESGAPSLLSDPHAPVDRRVLGGFVPPPSASETPLARGSRGRPLRLVGQYKGSLLLLEGEDGLYLVDQHAAHERILYERFRAQAMEGKVPSQRLMEARWLEASASETEALGEAASALESLGFEIAVMSAGSVGVTAIPAFFRENEAERLLLDLAARIVDADGPVEEVEAVRRETLEAMAASSACKAAVKIHRPLDLRQMETLIEDLFQAEQPMTCPHGRPTILKMTDSELERRFGRR